MQWTAADAKGHTKKADTKQKQKKWAEIANKTLEDTGDEGEAIATANKAMGRELANSIHEWPSFGPDAIETRAASLEPKTYSKDNRTVDAVLSRGSPVERFYGTETLRIHPDSIVLDRMKNGGIPILDSHRQESIFGTLGRIQKVWFDRGPSLMGRIAFTDTEQGNAAERMVSRGEIRAVSAGYRVMEWEVRDSEGNVVDPEKDRMRWDDKYSFEATRWEVLEASLVAVPADASAVIRSMDTAFKPVTTIFRDDVYTIRARMLARQRMTTARLRR